MTTTLIIGASGTVGSQVVADLDADHDGIDIRLSTSRPEAAEQWRAEGRDAVVLDLDKPEGFEQALAGVDRVFLLTGYTADMLYQSKTLIDAAVDAGVSHLVHIGVMTSGRDLVPHYTWHELIETYIEASGMAWTHVQPNVITDSVLLHEPSIIATGSFSVSWRDAARGWVAASDIAAVAATALRQGPAVHGGKNYRLSAEVLTGPQVADIINAELGTSITCTTEGPEALAAYIDALPSAGAKLYMASAVRTMNQTIAGHMDAIAIVTDDIEAVLGRPATTMRQFAREHLAGPLT